MTALTEPAPAKVNLSLLVTGRRPDGYHLLDSLVVFGPAADTVSATTAPGLSLRMEGPFASSLGPGDDNLVLRAARALAEWADRIPAAALVLHKRLPVASGIGGGSADAAATLRLLCRLWALSPGPGVLYRIAGSLGADVPVCLRSVPARMTGIGEVVAPVPPMPPCGLLLCNPGLPVATAEVFRARTGPFSPPPPADLRWADAAGLAATLRGLGNDLQAPALTVAPTIRDVLARLAGLPGCLHAGMSGSGATCYALFPGPPAAESAVPLLPSAWWRSAGPLYEPPSTALFTL